MGIFTWTFADDGRKKLNYDHKGYIACPDGTFIEEPCYNGYGRFNGFDIYDLVVEWNKKDLKNIFQRLKKEDPKHFGLGLENIAIAYADDNIQEVTKLVNKMAERMGQWFLSDWKRNIGIAIACNDDDNKALRYPIKISQSTNIPYDKLRPSKNTQ